MSGLKANRHKLHGKICRDGKVIGSGVPFISNDMYCVVTCHHVLYEEHHTETDSSTGVQDITFKVNSTEFNATRIVTEFNESKASDVLIIQLDSINEPVLHDALHLANQVEVDNLSNYQPEIVTSHPDELTIANVALAGHIVTCQEGNIESSVEKNSFFNETKGRGGAKEYKGVSGSGLFIEVDGQIILVGLLAKLPICSIEEQVVIKRLDSVHKYIPDSLSFQEIVAPLAPVDITDVCFLNYTEASRRYYYVRNRDKHFQKSVSGVRNTWLYGDSGTGKTAMVLRNLQELDIDHIYCDLQPVTIKSSDSIFRAVIEEVASKQEIYDTPDNLDIKSMSQFLIDCHFRSKLVIIIDEMSCSSDSIIEDFCQNVLTLVSYYQKQSGQKNITFVISSIFNPKEQKCDIKKSVRSFTFICSTGWAEHIEGLFDLQNLALGSRICDRGREIVLSRCNENPRILSNIVEDVYNSEEFTPKSISETTKRVVEKYSE